MRLNCTRIIITLGVAIILVSFAGCCTCKSSSNNYNEQFATDAVLTPWWFYMHSGQQNQNQYYTYLKQTWNYRVPDYGKSPSKFGGYLSAFIIAKAETPQNASHEGFRAKGIIYVDPYVAYLAAFNMAKYHNNYILPKAEYVLLSEPMRQKIAAEIENDTYESKKYFDLALGPLPSQPEISFERNSLEFQNEASLKELLYAGVKDLKIYYFDVSYQCWSGKWTKK